MLCKKTVLSCVEKKERNYKIDCIIYIKNMLTKCLSYHSLFHYIQFLSFNYLERPEKQGLKA